MEGQGLGSFQIKMSAIHHESLHSGSASACQLIGPPSKAVAHSLLGRGVISSPLYLTEALATGIASTIPGCRIWLVSTYSKAGTFDT